MFEITDELINKISKDVWDMRRKKLIENAPKGTSLGVFEKTWDEIVADAPDDLSSRMAFMGTLTNTGDVLFVLAQNLGGAGKNVVDGSTSIN